MRAPRRRHHSLIRASALAIAAVTAAPAVEAQTVIINGTTETSPPFAMSPSDDLIVGSTGTGVLNVTSGVLETNSTILGDAATGNGTVNVSGGGFGGPSSQFIIGNAGTGTFLGQASGNIYVYSGVTYIARLSGSAGTATLSGPGAEWNITASFEVGGGGNGTLTIDNGAEVNSMAGAVVANDAGSNGTVNIDAATWNAMGGVNIGYYGTGIVNLTNGATLDTGSQQIYFGIGDGASGTLNASGGSTITSGSAYIGYCGGGCDPVPTGVANISGIGTAWTLDGSLTVGYEQGSGTLNVTDGGVVSTINGGGLYVGYYHDSPGQVAVSGAGAQLNVSGTAYIGYEGEGTVTVSNGGLLDVTGQTIISYDDTAPATVTITGAGSQFLSNDVRIGNYGGAVGTLSVLDGAYADLSSVYIGSAAGGTGTLNVSGATTTWDSSASFYAGYDGTGTVNITGGMKFSGGSYLSDLYAGYNAGSQGTINISGAGTEVVADNYIYAGYGGTGTVNVTNGAVVTTDYFYAAGSAGSHGELLVSGSGTHLDGTYGVRIGYVDEAHALVTDGALLSASSDAIAVGYNSGGVAVLEVTNGGQISGQRIVIGDSSNSDGTVILSTGATATASTAVFMGFSGGHGTLVFGAAEGDAPVAAGSLSAPEIRFGNSLSLPQGVGEIVFNHTGSMDFDAALAILGGTGHEIKVLAGTTIFTANSGAFTGDMTVTGGKAVMNGTYGGAVTVSDTGIVGGSGMIASLDAQSGGTVSPGNSPGTLNATGPVSFAAGTSYIVEVAGAVSDLIAATGTATLNGGTVYVSGSPSLAQYTILSSSGLTGAFDGIESTSAFIEYSLDYDVNNAYLLIDGYNALTTAARTPNQYAVANALDKLPAGNQLYSAIIAGSVSDAQQAFNALSGEIHASVGTALADDSRYVREAITGRLIQAYYGGASAGGGQPIVLAAAAPTDVATIDASSRMSLGAGYGASRDAPAGGHNLAYWSRAFGAWGQYDTNGNAATTDRNLGGFITGVDGAFGGGWRAGLATGYLYTGLSADERYSSANINSYVLGGYAGGVLGHGFALRSGGTWTWNDVDSTRTVVFPGFFESENANYNGDVGQLFTELAYPLFTHGGVVEPFAGLAYVHVGTDGFTESGPTVGLTSGGLDMNLGYGTLGARAGTTVVWGGTTVIPHASLAWQYAFGDTTPQQALAFASTGIGMGIGGVPLAQNSALVEVGADALIGPEATLGLSYIGQYSGDFTDSGLRGRFNWKF